MNLQKSVILILSLFLFSTNAFASTNKLFIDFTLVSKHIGIDDNLNEINPGIGLSYFVSKNWELRAGYYNNSYSRPTFYVTANFIPFIIDLKNFDFNFGIAAGFASGYKDGEIALFGKSLIISEGIVPALAPNIEVLFKPINTRIVIILLGNALALQVSYMI